MSQKRSPEPGISVVTTTVMLMAVLALLVGALDLGKVMCFYQGLAERARAGARWGAANAFDPARIKNVVVYGNPDATGDTPPAFYNLTRSLVSVRLVEPHTRRARVEVTIKGYPFQFLSPWISGAYTPGPVVASVLESRQGAEGSPRP